ncbi:uncharacterized protein LOC114517596 [Dendronephthya gigantea]|uniref:uncharacterized protein LOC114517596 n=1 Tax=Dendronephthya gigantea TaxID=151771 RepID=UPI00106A5C86|nr:uncharacterized protein LOC114517596 [Dendronephthya gigantea]
MVYGGQQKHGDNGDLVDETRERQSEENDNIDESMSTASKRFRVLKGREKAFKTRLKIRLEELLQATKEGTLTGKTTIRRAITKARAELNILEKVTCALKENIVLGEGDQETDILIEQLDKELDDVSREVDVLTPTAEQLLHTRIHILGEPETERSQTSEKDDLSIISSLKGSSAAAIEKRQQDADEGEKRLEQFEEEQRKLENDLKKYIANVELGKQRTEDARRVAALNRQRAKQACEESGEEKFTRNVQTEVNTDRQTEVEPTRIQAVKLKGVELPTFSGDDKAEYESWKAAYMSVVDGANIAVKEKMLRLQSCLTGKALKIAKDLGYSENAYKRALEKLDKKFGGERRLAITLLTRLRGWPKLRRRNLEDMEDFLTVLDKILVAIQDNVDLNSQHLNLTAKEKLSEEDLQSYKYWLCEHSKEDCFQTLVEWIEMKVRILDEVKEEVSSDVKCGTRTDNRKNNRGLNTDKKPRKCIVEACQADHPPWVCQLFKGLPVANRKELIAKSGRCFCCLASGHLSKSCPRKIPCGINGCKSVMHSRYLHDPSVPSTDGNHDSGDETQDQAKNKTFNTNRVEKVSLMVLLGFVSKTDTRKKLKVNIMLDPCLTGSYISESAAEELNLQGNTQHLTISGTGGAEVQKVSRRVQLIVSNVKGGFSAEIEANVLDSITGTTPAIQWSELKDKWPHLKQIPFEKVSDRCQIDLLIGSDHPLFHHVTQEKCGPEINDPIARKTNLGWVCFGPTSTENVRNYSRIHVTRTYQSDQYETKGNDTTNKLLRKFWELDSMGIRDEDSKPLTPDEARATKSAEETLHHLQDNRYEIGIPWRVNEPRFTNNYEQALSRLVSLERSLRKKGAEVSSSYQEIIEEYVKKNYVRKVSPSTEEQWFIPHFPVIRNDKATTKVRIVFDAAAKYDGKCLNDAVLSGPKLQQDLVDVLCRFRRAPVALSANISQMFLQVGLRQQDRAYHRFLWRDLDDEKDPEVYEFQRLPFGNASSPFCAQYVLKTHAKAVSEKKPSASETIENAMYVDDVLDSCETVSEACFLRRDLSDVLSDAGFKSRKWLSNEPSVLAEVSVEDRAQGVEIRDGENLPTQKTLGVSWNAKRTRLSFKSTYRQIPLRQKEMF